MQDLVRWPGARSADRFSRTAALCAALALLLGAGSALGGVEGTYGLTVDSSFQQGCFPPLACPVQIPQAIGGTFRLIEIPTPRQREIEQFLVTDVFWLVRWGGEDVRITGSGTLTRFSEFAVVQRLELFLRIGDAEAQRFDSGFVVDVDFPDLDITISKYGQRLNDTVIRVNAVPFRSPVSWRAGVRAGPARTGTNGP